MAGLRALRFGLARGVGVGRGGAEGGYDEGVLEEFCEAGAPFQHEKICYADGKNFGASGIVRLAIEPDGAITRALIDLARSMNGGQDT